MYLSLLKETEKEFFLKAAYDLSSVDGVLGDEEKQMLTLYCNEMQIDDCQPTVTDSNKTMQKIAIDSSHRNKKIIIFELVGLAISDDNYDTTEKDFIASMAEKLGLTKAFIEDSEVLIRNYLTLQNNITKLVVE